MRKIRKPMVLALLLGLIFLMGAPGLADSKPLVLKAVSVVPIQSPEAWPLKQFMERVAEASKGEIKIDYRGSYDAIPVYNQAEATRTGAVDLCMTFVGIYSKLAPEVQSLTYSQLKPWEERERGFFDHMVKVHEQIDLRYLGRGISYEPCFFFLTNKKLGSPEDFKGMKFSTGPVFLPLFKKLGVTGVVMPQPEKYNAMERGVVEGINNPLTLSADLSLYEVSKYILDQGLFAVDVALIMNLKKWNSLTKAQQQMINDIMKKLERDAADYFQGIITKARKKFQDAGVEFITFSPEDADRFQKMAYDACWGDLEKRIGAEKYQNLRKLVSK